MVGILTPEIGKAMAKQANRVNNDPKALLARIEDQQNIIATQKDVIKRLREENARLRGGAAPEAVPVAVEYVSASRFARMHGCAVSTVTRKFHAGKLRGKQDDKGYISIEAHQVFSKGRRTS